MAKRKTAPPWRAAFLRALKATGNVRASARAAGVDHSSAYGLRKRDGRFQEKWEKALANRPSPQPWSATKAASRGSSHALHPASGRGGKKEELVLRPSKRWGAQMVKVAEGRWSAKREATFLAHLGVTGCVRRAARGAGLSTTALYARRNAHPDFAAKWIAARAAADEYLSSLVHGAAIATFDPEAAAEEEGAPKVTVGEAIAILRLRRPGKDGGQGNADRYAPGEPSIEEVRDEVLRRLAAIRRHRKGD